MSTTLEMQGIVKRFGGVTALRGVDFTVRSGEVHALLGENGGGKSTLMKVLTGAILPDEGRIVVDGAPVTVRGPRDARGLGVACIYQETSLCPDLSVVENLFLGEALRTRWGAIDWARMAQRGREVLSGLGLQLPLDARTGDLSKAERQLTEIARALLKDARILIMDEPTAALTDAEVERLFALVRRLREQGTAIVYISHRLAEVFALADRVSVLRDGQLAGSAPVAEITPEWIIRQMVGRDIGQLYPRTRREPGAVVLDVDALSNPPAFTDVSFQVRAGEIVGLAGLVGSGRSEIARAIYGIDRPTSGRVRLNGDAAGGSPWSMQRRGLALVPEDRTTQGVLLSFTLAQNLTLAAFDQIREHGLISRRAESSLAQKLIGELHVRPPREELQVGMLSGGNQQKIAIGRMLAIAPRLLILDEPTQGIDVGAKAEIHALIDRLVGAGLGLLLISSDLPEVLGMADRILVMRAGRLVAELPAGSTSADVMQAANGLSAEVARVR